MHAIELSGVVAEVAERSNHRARRATDEANLEIAQIRERQHALLPIRREADVPDGARRTRLLAVDIFGDEAAIALEHLHAIVVAIADVHQPIARHLHAVNVSKLR